MTSTNSIHLGKDDYLGKDDWCTNVFPDSNSAKALSDSRSARGILKYLEPLEYICLS